MNRQRAIPALFAATVITGLLGACSAQARSSSAGNGLCSPTTRLTTLSGLPEASGITLSRRTPGLLWSHNDSGDPVLVALDTSGATKGGVRVTGVEMRDWEAIAAGRCSGSSCLYLADIGDNNRIRRQIALYRVPEPQPGDKMTASAQRWIGTYPDGAHDAEAVFITPEGQLYVVTKEDASKTGVYRFPQPAGTEVVQLQMVSKLPLTRVTDASAAGEWVALRTNHELLFYRTRDLLSGAHAEPRRFDLRVVGEPQGEGVALGSDGIVHLIGEGGGGTFATLRCALR